MKSKRIYVVFACNSGESSQFDRILNHWEKRKSKEPVKFVRVGGTSTKGTVDFPLLC